MTRWRDHEDRPVEVPDPPDEAYYAAIGDHQGPAYERNAFAQATSHEVDVLWRAMGLEAGARILDVGCGTGRHLREAAARGAGGTGVDVSTGLVEAARDAVASAGLEGLRFVRHDARGLDAVVPEGAFDAAWSLHQGAIGTDPEGDAGVVAGIARAVRPGGRVAITVFHALFAVRHLVRGDVFDPVRLVHHHRGDVHAPAGQRRFDLWTVSYTVPGAVRLLEDAGLVVDGVTGVEPGRYDGTGVGLDDPELLLLARRPTASAVQRGTAGSSSA